MSDSEEDYGPMPSANSAQEVDAAQEFREREQRIRELQQPSRTTSRPEWMVEMPEDQGIAATLRPDAGPLRSRGFQQGGRVQRHGAGSSSSGDAEQARQMWTETPDQRRQRILRGDQPETSRKSEEDRRAQELAAKRDAETRARITEMDPSRNTRLIDQHREKQIQARISKNKESNSDPTSIPDRPRSDHNQRSRAKDYEHHKHPTHSRRESSSRHSRHRERDHSKHGSHRDRSDYHRDRHSSASSSSSSKRRRTPSPPRKLTRAEREAADLAQGTTPYFDKDKVLGAGSRMLDSQARARTVASATDLGSRFSNGAKGSFL